MKSLIILSIALPLACTVIAGGESQDNVPFVCVSTDSVVNGFYLKPYLIKPFSPVFNVEFNLPESSLVTLFVTDTSESDTIWHCRQESMAPGLYKIQGGAIDRMREKLSGGWVDVHLHAESSYGTGRNKDISCLFIAKRRM